MLDRRHLVDELELAMGVTEGLAQGGQVPVHRGLRDRRAFSIAAPAGMLQGPGLEGLDLRLLDFRERQAGPRPVVEEPLIALPVKLDRALLFRLGGSDPLVKRGLKLGERGYGFARFFGGKNSGLRFFQSSRLADDARPRCGRDRFGLAPVFRARRTIVFPAAVLELVGVVRASGSFEYFHQPAARRVFEATNWRMVSGRIMTRVPTFT